LSTISDIAIFARIHMDPKGPWRELEKQLRKEYGDDSPLLADELSDIVETLFQEVKRSTRNTTFQV
jgi:hypothetical protein